jgi:hypothetical protein
MRISQYGHEFHVHQPFLGGVRAESFSPALAATATAIPSPGLPKSPSAHKLERGIGATLRI